LGGRISAANDSTPPGEPIPIGQYTTSSPLNVVIEPSADLGVLADSVALGDLLVPFSTESHLASNRGSPQLSDGRQTAVPPASSAPTLRRSQHLLRTQPRYSVFPHSFLPPSYPRIYLVKRSIPYLSLARPSDRTHLAIRRVRIYNRLRELARSYNLDIFNDLAEPFQTQPAPLVPVHQGGAEVPVQQGNTGTIVPVHQGNSQISSGLVPLVQPGQELLSLLPNLPAIEGSHQPLGIEPRPQSAGDLDIILRDPTPAAQAALIPLPPSPPSVEVTLHDYPVEAKSQEITLLDAAPVEAASEELALGNAAPLFPPRETSEYAETESTDILDCTFGGLNIAMSPGQPDRQPEYNAAMADELQRLRAEMSQLRLARDADSLELQRLWAINQSNAQALERAEVSYHEEARRRKEAEEAAARAAQPRIVPPRASGLAASRHAPNGKQPEIGEPGPSNWQAAQQAAARPNPYVTGQPLQHPPPPQFFQPANPPPDLATNPFLRVPHQPQRLEQTMAIPTRTEPPQGNADLLTELTRLQALFASNQHAVNQQILDRLTAPAHAVAMQGPRTLPPIKASDVGTFNPTSMPDAAAAILFIDKIQDAVKQYGEDRTLLVLKRCCNNDIASSWLTGLDAQDRDALITSAEAWERLLRRDFMPKLADLEAKAKEEVFKWSQNRTPSQYVSDKIKLLRIAGITNPDAVVYELHKGFSRCPELQIPLTQAVRETGNDLARYRREVLNYQDMAKLQYEYNQRSGNRTYAPRDRTTLPTGSAPNADTNNQIPSTRTSPPKDRVRKRKCRNFPHCGDGEHWDFECKIKGRPRESKRAYYAVPDDDSDELGHELYVEMRDEDYQLETEYALDQNAHFARAYCVTQGFFVNNSTKANEKTSRATTPKPSECRGCHEAFPSRSRLHAHLLASGHNRVASRAHFAVIKSKHVAPLDHEARLASYHYAEAQFVLHPGSTDTRVCCMDSGYGNSAVDAGFIARHIAHPTYHMLKEPKEVHGIGGGIAMCTKLLLLPVYYPTMDGNYAQITRPFHVFPDLGVELLCGVDTIREEGIDMFYSSSVPQMRIASCENAAVRIEVHGERITKIPVRAAATIVIPANSTTVVAIKTPRPLPSNQDYLFTPSRLKSVSTSGAGAPHAVCSHDQRNVLFTNLQDTPMTLFKNTVLGHLQSAASEEIAVWHEAAKEVRGFLGLSRLARACTAGLAFAASAKATFDPEIVSDMPVPETAPFPLEPPRPRPCPVAAAALPGAQCSEELWSPPAWLQEPYVPNYEYDLPAGITVPDVSSSTYAEVVINDSDDISPEQVEALRQLVKRHPHLFNDGMGCVREPIEDWMRLPVDRAYELRLKPRGPYRLSKNGEAAVDENFDDLHRYGRLERVTKATPWGLQVFVVYTTAKKRPVIDMRLLNDGLAGDSYPLPRMESIIEPLQGMRWLGTVDITSAFYQRLLHPDDRHRTAVVTHRGVEQFATTVMGCKNSVQHQQKLMDRRVLSKLSWRGASCYVDDIVIYAETFEKFLQMADEVFRILSDLGITLKARKCYLGFHSIELLGYLVDRLGLTTTEAKSDAVKMIPFPATLAQLEHFIGLTNWNRHLVPYYAQRVAPLQACKTALLKLGPSTGRARKSYAAKTPIPKDAILEKSFEDLKEALASRPRLHHAIDGSPIYAFLDTSREYGTGLAVYQLTGDPDTYCKTRLVPLHFLSKQLTAAESRYWPTDMELSGLVWSAKKLRPYMERSFVWFVTDHKPNVDIFDMKSLQTTSTSRSNLRLQTWGIYLSQFWGRMQVVYSKGANLDCPDALSRLAYQVSDDAARFRTWAASLGKAHDTAEFEVSEAFIVTHSTTNPKTSSPVVGDTTPSADSTAVTTAPEEEPGLSLTLTPEYLVKLRASVMASKRLTAIYNRLRSEAAPTNTPNGTLYELPSSCQYVILNDLLYLVDPRTKDLRLVLGPDLRKEQIEAAHGPIHLGFGRTYAALKGYFWPDMAKDVGRFVKHCPDCLRKKPTHHRPYGMLAPVPAPDEPFETVSIDLVTDLPECALRDVSTLYDTIMTVTDKFSKAVRLLPGRKDWNAAQWADSYYEGVVLSGWGYPRTLISDRDRRFLSALWTALLEKAGTKHITTTAYHPSADGQAERTNFTLEVALRFVVNNTQTDWVSYLQLVEAVLNNTTAAATKKAPNELIYGKVVRLQLNASISGRPSEPADDIAAQREHARKEAQLAIAFAQKAMALHYDSRHARADFSSGWVFLNLGNGYRSPAAHKQKLAPQRLGPFRVLEVVGAGKAFRLELPPDYDIHDVISIAHLEPSPAPNEDPYARLQPSSEVKPVYADADSSEWEIDSLVNKRVRKSGRKRVNEYLVRWKGFGPEYDSWRAAKV
jgi:transposase InsO family protein